MFTSLCCSVQVSVCFGNFEFIMKAYLLYGLDIAFRYLLLYSARGLELSFASLFLFPVYKYESLSHMH